MFLDRASKNPAIIRGVNSVGASSSDPSDTDPIKAPILARKSPRLEHIAVHLGKTSKPLPSQITRRSFYLLAPRPAPSFRGCSSSSSTSLSTRSITLSSSLLSTLSTFLKSSSSSLLTVGLVDVFGFFGVRPLDRTSVRTILMGISCLQTNTGLKSRQLCVDLRVACVAIALSNHHHHIFKSRTQNNKTASTILPIGRH